MAHKVMQSLGGPDESPMVTMLAGPAIGMFGPIFAQLEKSVCLFHESVERWTNTVLVYPLEPESI